ncbi:NirD/YgiW/YdeI family stress tolerance protein [Pseudomonas sp. NW5]|uniref:YgiW/YdeI family stress tolerance OB fold protein n=1 Tax=Pseudomonas sp. NW5 TaxID=2934934 RepID=UPI00202056A3|nr:NirD/YgiW/YdeI family stress tolerance protein [Pseudomonas sp. NW5]MCL7463008.1 NirD/YgiW/YdeI family stress tolerance protein [Pseudomonas sp. NW5]
MKNRTLLALLIAPLFSTAALAAGYTGPGATPSAAAVSGYTGPGAVQANRVAAALEAADDTPVVLEGRLLRQIRGEHYEFADDSGTIEVEIDHEDMPAQPIDQNSRVRLYGEVDRDLTSRSIDVDRVELLP